MAQETTLAEASAVHRRKPGTFDAVVAPGWDVAGATNGGYLAVMITRAVLAETSRADPVAVATHFLAPVQPGPVTIELDPLHDGRRFATASARLVGSDGRVCVAALATVGDLEPGAGPTGEQAVLVDGRPPDLPPAPDCVLLEPTSSMPPPLVGRVRLRLPDESAGFLHRRPSGSARMTGWFSLPGDPAVTSLDALLAADAFPPTVFNAELPVSWTPTIELSVHVRSRPSGTALRCAFRTRFVTGGFLEADGEIWDDEGRLVALSRQLALVPRP